MKLGVCYYPEHWPQEQWADDAARMVELGLSTVRIGEFAWSLIEPDPGRFDWAWLDRAIATLSDAGLSIIFGTPTATPPKWLIDRSPDILAWGRDGRPRRFGSRRHYCFSSPTYRRETARIVTALAERYGLHPAIIAWQTDNEFGCHDTVRSYSPAAIAAFRQWLAGRYGTIDALNEAWGTSFWSQTYRTFKDVDAPTETVTEAHPAHVMDFARFSSDQVISYNHLQADIIRHHAPNRIIVHNFMGFFTQFDHFRLSQDLDVASWDSYPIGNLNVFWFSSEEKRHWLRQGHPDLQAFHHDLYRSCGRGRMWVMEQQPGPVNWAPVNPAPAKGMVRLWTIEARAHGAELVSYFRWRQVPFAQEQMHAGLLGRDGRMDQGGIEARAAAEDLAVLGAASEGPREVALILDYDAHWAVETQPHGAGFRHDRLCFEFYSAARANGCNIDILPPDASLDGYKLAVIPSLPIWPRGLVERLAQAGCPVVIGPRTGARTNTMQLPERMAPDGLQDLIPIKIRKVETLPAGAESHGQINGQTFSAAMWREDVEADFSAHASTDDGCGIWFASKNVHYLACWPDAVLLDAVLKAAAQEAGLAPFDLPRDIRVRRDSRHLFIFNYGHEPFDAHALIRHFQVTGRVLGDAIVPPYDLSVWAKAG